jgi:hypothetical protein
MTNCLLHIGQIFKYPFEQRILVIDFSDSILIQNQPPVLYVKGVCLQLFWGNIHFLSYVLNWAGVSHTPIYLSCF